MAPSRGCPSAPAEADAARRAFQTKTESGDGGLRTSTRYGAERVLPETTASRSVDAAGAATRDRARSSRLRRESGSARDIAAGRRRKMPSAAQQNPCTDVGGVHLPYPVALRRHRCCQTRRRHATQFAVCCAHTLAPRSLPVGTPVLAAADGVVAAALDGPRLRHAGRDAARANYVALRHADDRAPYARHLASVGVRCGERVRAGARLGLSGNTGYTASRTSTLTSPTACRPPPPRSPGRDARGGDRATTPDDALRCAAGVAVAGGPDAPLRLGCLPAAFSGPLPAAPAVLDAVWADPPNAAEEALRNAAETRGRILFVDRCADVDFYDKGLRAEAAGAAAVVVVNSTEDGPALHAMAYPKRLRGTPGARPLRIPALMARAMPARRRAPRLRRLEMTSPPSSSSAPPSTGGRTRAAASARRRLWRGRCRSRLCGGSRRGLGAARRRSGRQRAWAPPCPRAARWRGRRAEAGSRK